VAGAATASPHGLVQEFLNRSDDHLWAVVSNGLILRLLRDNASLTRQAYVEFDLQAMFDGELFSDFVVLWLACHRTRFEGDPPEKCLLERWSVEAAQSGTRALDKLRDGVEHAIEALGEGFVAHPANTALRSSLHDGTVTATELQHQVLRVVYRLLFLLVAESRDLLRVPGADEAASERYRRFYSVHRLRQLAEHRRGTAHDDLWDALQITMRSLHRDGAPELGLTPLGSLLWDPDTVAALEGARLDNRHLLDAIRHLCFVHDDRQSGASRRRLPQPRRRRARLDLRVLLELHPTSSTPAPSPSPPPPATSARPPAATTRPPPHHPPARQRPRPRPRRGARRRPRGAILDLKVLDPAAAAATSSSPPPTASPAAWRRPAPATANRPPTTAHTPARRHRPLPLRHRREPHGRRAVQGRACGWRRPNPAGPSPSSTTTSSAATASWAPHLH
jgi:hypothetical protein